MKKCPKCQIDKPSIEFYIRGSKLSSYCKPCSRSIIRVYAKRRYHKENFQVRVKHDPSTSKTCAQCKLYKGPDEFYLIENKSRLYSYCIPCVKDIDRKARQRRSV